MYTLHALQMLTSNDSELVVCVDRTTQQLEQAHRVSKHHARYSLAPTTQNLSSLVLLVLTHEAPCKHTSGMIASICHSMGR